MKAEWEIFCDERKPEKGALIYVDVADPTGDPWLLRYWDGWATALEGVQLFEMENGDLFVELPELSK
jgi:hypothetical protein